MPFNPNSGLKRITITTTLGNINTEGRVAVGSKLRVPKAAYPNLRNTASNGAATGSAGVTVRFSGFSGINAICQFETISSGGGASTTNWFGAAITSTGGLSGQQLDLLVEGD